MMDVLSAIWGSVSYVGAVWVAGILVGSKLPRRRFFAAKCVLFGVMMCALSYLLYAWSSREKAFAGSLWATVFSTANCFLVFLATLLGLRLLYRCDWWRALFCATSGYCMEHMSQRTYLFVCLPFGAPTFWADTLLLVTVRAVAYGLLYYFFIRKIDLNSRNLHGKAQIIISMIAILLTVFINSFASRMAAMLGAEDLNIFFWTFSLLASVLVLFVEFYQFAYQNAETEKSFLKVLMQQEQEQYRREKSTMEVLNVKCHDLKHQLAALERRWSKEELRDLHQVVEAYDSFFRTGNVAIDTVLSVKKLVCEDKKIEMTCIVDGAALGFMAESDLYSLFGNILDNAIEAVEKFEEADRRILSLTVSKKGGFALIHEENYCSGTLAFSGGLPVSTKGDDIYHGFGLSSVRMIAQKYGGSCSVQVKDTFFYVDLLLPVPV